MDNHNVVVYKTESSNVKLEVKVSDETVWLTQTQMAILFDCSTDNISLHLKNIYEEHEIDSDSTSENFSVVRLEGNRRVTRTVKHYNLDAILSVGYRVSSASATKFRQWANSVLKDYLLRGYAVHQRIVYLEQKVAEHDKKIDFFVKTSLPPVEGVFYNGQIFDAYNFISDLVRKAKNDSFYFVIAVTINVPPSRLRPHFALRRGGHGPNAGQREPMIRALIFSVHFPSREKEQKSRLTRHNNC